VLRLPTYPQKDDTIKATIWGQFIHQFLYTFFSEVKLNPECNTQSHFFNTARKLYQTYSRKTFFWSVKHHLLFGSSTSLGIIQSLWDYLQSHPLPQTPYQFEHPFSISLSQDETKLVITGVIDLLMKTHGESWMSVLDYKTSSRLPIAKDISDLRSLQLPIYMLATKRHYPHHQISGGLLFKIRDQNTIEYTVACCDIDAKQTVFNVGSKRPYTFDSSFFNQIQTHLIQLKSCMDQSKYSYSDFPNPKMTASYREQNACRLCEFHMLCRYPNRFAKR
jgi:ATP-dependent helicase/DNAse subunit B